MTVLPRAYSHPPATPPAAVAPPAAPPTRLERALHAPDTRFTRWLVRWRFWFFAGLVLLMVIQFNGQWRLGLDSSIYRGVADNLAAGRGYTFAGRPQTQVYPGLPFILAGFQKIFGTQSLVPPLVLMNVLGVVTLVGVYHLIKLRYPLWVAVAVTCGVGMNSRFLQQAQEIMTDMPFLCAVVWSMLAWEWLGVVKGRGKTIGVIALLGVCLFVAATMRPTFWVLAAAWAIAAFWGAVRYREKRSIIALGVLLVVLLAFMKFDPRARGMGLMQGAYEKQVLMILPDLAERAARNAQTLFSRQIPEAFFNEVMSVAGVASSILLLAGAVIVSRRQPLWGLQVLILTLVMLAISDVPRYYLMVLPTLWLSYTLIVLWLTSGARPIVRDLTLFAVFSIANVQNLGGALNLTVDQHTKPFTAGHKPESFNATMATADMLRKNLGPDDVAIGPNGQVLSYLSGRQVLNGRLMGFDTQKPTKYANLTAAAQPKFVVGPLSDYKVKDDDLYKLLSHGVVVPGKLIARAGPGERDAWLAEARVVVPAGDWRQTPRIARFYPLAPNTRRPVESEQAAANRKLKAERAARAARQAHKQLKAQRAERAAYLERKARKLRRQKQQAAPAATQPTSLIWPVDGFDAAGPGGVCDVIGDLARFASSPSRLSMPA